MDEDHRERHVAVLFADELVRVLAVLEVVESNDRATRLRLHGARPRRRRVALPISARLVIAMTPSAARRAAVVAP